ncbi:MAG: hypothetical protein PHT33_12515 [bacterium]|nr:hypothetical protein [bacterium]
MMAIEELYDLLAEPEGARLEFKKAGNRYDFDELARYCVALANEGRACYGDWKDKGSLLVSAGCDRMMSVERKTRQPA